MTACSRFPFATAVRMIYGVHDDAAHRRPDTAPASRACFTEGTQGMLFVADLAYGGAAIDVNLADFARPQTQLSIGPLPRQQLH